MSDSVLRLAAEIYSPFEIRETHRLRGYVYDVEELVGSAFFRPGEQKLTLSAEMGGPLQTTLVYPGEEAVRAVVGLFRQLYNHHEPTSYHQIIKLLSRHAHERGSQRRDAAVAETQSSARVGEGRAAADHCAEVAARTARWLDRLRRGPHARGAHRPLPSRQVPA